MSIRFIGRFSRPEKMLRLFCAVKNVGKVGDGVGFSRKTTLAIVPRIFAFRREREGWKLTILGIRIHRVKSFGGIFT